MSWPKKHPLALYFILAYLISWSIWSPLVLSAQGLIRLEIPPAWHLAGSLGPFLSALIVTSITTGFEGIRELTRRIYQWRVGIKWWGFALSPLILYLLAALAQGLIEGSLDFRDFGSVNELPELPWLVGWLVMILTFGLGEETGWRGFALPRLQSFHSAAGATLRLLLFWLGWHLPMFFYKESFIEMGFLGAIGWAVSLAFGAVLLTWLYNSSKGSILIVIIWHGTYNAAVAAAAGNIAMITSFMVIIWAIIIARRYGPATFSSIEKHTL